MLSILIILISKTPIEIKSSWLYHDYTLLCQSREAIRWNVAKHPPLSSLGRSPPFPRPHRFWRAAQGGKHTHRLRRTPGATTLTFTHVPSAQFGYVIFDFIADSIPGLHRRILSAVTIARRSSHAMVHFHPESSSPANEYWSEALARPPSALGAEGHAVTLVAPLSFPWGAYYVGKYEILLCCGGHQYDAEFRPALYRSQNRSKKTKSFLIKFILL